jgi:hypothetical protein
MPHFRLRAVEPQTVQLLSKTLIDDLEGLMKSPREDFTFEYIYSTFFHEGEVNKGYPFVEVLWFDRGQDVQDRVAKILTERVKEIIGQEINVAVIFTALKPNEYYDNAEHY